MATRATKVFEDLKLRSPVRILNWMTENIKPIPTGRFDVAFPTPTVLKRKAAINLEAAALQALLLRVAGYTPMIYFMCDQGNKNSYAITVYSTMNKWYWMEWYDPMTRAIHEYESKKELIEDFRRYFIGRYSTYTDLRQLNNIEMTDYISLDEDLDLLLKGADLETRLGECVLLSLNEKTIRFFCKVAPELNVLPMDDETYTGYLLYQPKQGEVVGFLQWSIYSKRLLSFYINKQLDVKEVLHAALKQMLETQSVYYAELTEHGLGDYESVFSELGFNVIHRDRDYKTVNLEYFGPYRVIPKNPYGASASLHYQRSRF